jgi:putative transposase
MDIGDAHAKAHAGRTQAPDQENGPL